jgi:hypothetical protein
MSMYDGASGSHRCYQRFSFSAQRCDGQRSFVVPSVAQLALWHTIPIAASCALDVLLAPSAARHIMLRLNRSIKSVIPVWRK